MLYSVDPNLPADMAMDEKARWDEVKGRSFFAGMSLSDG